jgi:hypothetical protein
MTATGESDSLTRAFAGIIAEARAHVAAGRDPNGDALQARIRAAAERARGGAGEEGAREVAQAERAALKQLERVLSVHRARTLLTRQPAPATPPPAVPGARRRPAIRTKPTITGNMEVRRQGEATLVWDAPPAVVEWEVRFAERPDTGGDYVVRETLTLPGPTRSVELPLGDRALRVNLLGRGRDGRLVRRALISGLTRAGWTDRWQRRASAA